MGLSCLAAMLVYQSGTPTWRPRINQAIIWHFNPIVQPSNALSLPNFGSQYIFACSMQNIQGVDKKSGHPWKYGYFGITFAREQELMENDMFLECM